MMNLATPQGLAIRDYQAAPINRSHVAIGVGISLLVHLLFFAWSWQQRSLPARTDRERIITVRLQSTPAVPQEKAPVPPVAPKDDKQQVKSSRPARPAQAVPVPAAPALQVDQTAPQKEQQPNAPAAQPEKHLDMNAIYGSVKTAVAEVDREKAETPNGQLVAKPLYGPEDGNKMGKMINGTTRADCKEQVAAYGLLAPLAVAATLLDKKDNGCKWR